MDNTHDSRKYFLEIVWLRFISNRIKDRQFTLSKNRARLHKGWWQTGLCVFRFFSFYKNGVSSLRIKFFSQLVHVGRDGFCWRRHLPDPQNIILGLPVAFSHDLIFCIVWCWSWKYESILLVNIFSGRKVLQVITRGSRGGSSSCKGFVQHTRTMRKNFDFLCPYSQ